jgi:Plasmid pRiA4b ORF-3-like protein
MKDSIISVSITLLDVAPAIWRRIEVPADCSLEGLHDVIQILMGWADDHPLPVRRRLNVWRVLARRPRDERRAQGQAVYAPRRRRAHLPISLRLRRRLVLRRGAGSRRPDDPGRLLSAPRRGRQERPTRRRRGPWGYGEFLDAIEDPKHERHTELLEWCGGHFDPQQFDVDQINRRLASLAPRKSSRRKTIKSAAG